MKQLANDFNLTLKLGWLTICYTSDKSDTATITALTLIWCSSVLMQCSKNMLYTYASDADVVSPIDKGKWLL